MTVDPSLAACFAAVAEAKSFTRAAVRLGLTQPQVSLRIAKLEHQLGFPVLARTTRQVELTQLGRSFLPYADDIVRACNAAQTFAASVESQQANVLRMGSPEVSLAQNVRSELVKTFMDRYPRARLDIRVANLRILWDQLVADELDVVLNYNIIVNGRRPPVLPGCEETPLLQRIGYVCVPQENPLAKRDALRISDLAGQSIVISPGNDCPNAIEQLRHALTRMGVRITLAPETHRATLEHMAVARRMLYFIWAGPDGLNVKPQPGMVMLSVEDSPFVLELSVLSQRASQSMLKRRFVDMASDLAATYWNNDNRPPALARAS
jgi:DNA-binding transcriptional LysR family regulator